MNTRFKIVTVKALKKKIADHRREGKTIAFTNGCFDLIHYGHISYLEKAKKNNRVLIIGLNSDSSVKKIKGPLRPIVPQKERASVLAALACVDYVTIFNEDTPHNLIDQLRPDLLIKGADWKGKKVAGSNIIHKVEYIRYIPNCSTSKIIESILERG